MWGGMRGGGVGVEEGPDACLVLAKCFINMA